MAQQQAQKTKKRIRFSWEVLIFLIFLWANIGLLKSAGDLFINSELGELIVSQLKLKDKLGETSGGDNFGLLQPNVAMIDYDETLLTEANQFWVSDYDASSYLVTSKGNEYPPYYCVDGDINTCWQDGVEGFAEGTVFNFYFNEPKDIRYIRIRAGRADKDEKFYENGRPQYISINVGGQSWQLFLEDMNAYQLVELTNVSDVDSVQLVIDTVYEGSKWEDTCISEVEFYE